VDRLIDAINKMKNPSVFGLDPKIDYVPQHIREKSFSVFGKGALGAADAIWEFNKALIDALCDIVPAVKPQSAYYEMYGIAGLMTLKKTIDYAKSAGLYVLLDVKRNDIGSTAEAYATAYLGKTQIDGDLYEESFGCDAVTINGYLGTDGIKPFTDACKQYDKDCFALVKTSNPSSGELQDMDLAAGGAVCEKMAALVEGWGADNIGAHGYSRVGAVVGATYPEHAAKLRALMPHTFFLVPGYGAQGGKASDVAANFDKNGSGAIVNSSRGIMCAYRKGDYTPEQFAQAARDEAIRMREELNSIL